MLLLPDSDPLGDAVEEAASEGVEAAKGEGDASRDDYQARSIFRFIPELRLGRSDRPLPVYLQDLLERIASDVNARRREEARARGGNSRATQKAREDDRRRRIEAVVANLARCVVYGFEGVAVSLRHDAKAAYRPPIMKGERRPIDPAPIETNDLGDVLGWMAATGWLALEKGQRKRGVSKIAPTQRLVSLLRENHAGPSTLGADHEEVARLEVIFLNGPPRKETWRDASGRARSREVRERIAYCDDVKSRALRERVRAVNDRLRELRLGVDNEGLARPYDAERRRLHRTFSLGRKTSPPSCQAFDRGGRLFGGFWQEMRKEDRHRLRFIGSDSRPEVAAEVDYEQMFLRIAYALHNRTPPPGDDLYAIPGLEGCDRDAVKILINALWFRRLQNWPRDKEGRSLSRFFPGLKFNEVVRLIVEHHSGLGLNEGGEDPIGHTLGHHESEILLGVLEACAEREISALPLHDAILVPHSKRTGAADVMMEVYARHFEAYFTARGEVWLYGAPPKVTVEDPRHPVPEALIALVSALARNSPEAFSRWQDGMEVLRTRAQRFELVVGEDGSRYRDTTRPNKPQFGVVPLRQLPAPETAGVTPRDIATDNPRVCEAAAWWNAPSGLRLWAFAEAKAQGGRNPFADLPLATLAELEDELFSQAGRELVEEGKWRQPQ